ncbi:MAG TPA: hypothetical protein VFE32_17570 [Puia sp.]|jgi:hypothetical protein|nr:hypothetical protein [Puia sp.]
MESLEILNRQLKFLGFGENTLLNQQLEEHILKEEPEFELYTDAFYEHFVRVEAKLHFLRHVKKGIYIFDHYVARIQYEQDPDRNKQRLFHVYKGTGVTFKEAYNLLDGRAAKIDQINQDDERFSVWAELDLDDKDTQVNYRFKYYRHYDLDKVLATYPIAEYQSEATRKMLLASLERGNKHLVTLNTGKPEPKWIEANPADRTIRIYAPIPSKKRGSDERRSARRSQRAAPGPAGEKATEDQELPEETTAGSRN